jgi:hypothetical protein
MSLRVNAWSQQRPVSFLLLNLLSRYAQPVQHAFWYPSQTIPENSKQNR